MKLYQEDIPVIAKGRVEREEKANTNRFLLIAIIAVGAGAVMMYVWNQLIGAIVAGAGILIYFWYDGVIKQKAKVATRRLMAEYEKGD